jgi:hypothetical protein
MDSASEFENLVGLTNMCLSCSCSIGANEGKAVALKLIMPVGQLNHPPKYVT